LYKKLEDVGFQQSELAVRNNYLNYLLEYIEKEHDLDQIILPSSIGLSDGVLSTLVTRMIDVQIQLKMMTNDGKIESPYVKELRAGMLEIKRDIAEAVRNQQGIDKIKNDHLSREIGILERQIAVLPAAEKELISIKRN